MFEDYGINRVVGVKDVLPVLAWKLDNRRLVYDNELLVKVSDIHLEAANFKQICNEAKYDPDRVKDIITNMVNSRGKLHNPYTNTGGLIFGTVEKIGSKYTNKKSIKVGDEILVLISASMIPLHISKVNSIDFVCGQLNVDGYCILFNNSSIIKKPSNIQLFLLMMAFEESSSIYHVYQLAEGKKSFLIIASNLITAVLYGYAIRKATGGEGKISVLLCQTDDYLKANENGRLETLIGKVFDNIYFMNFANPLKCTEEIIKKNPNLFDLSTNCVDSLGAEAINVLTTKEKGIVFFSGLINNYNIAVFLTEGIEKELNLLCGDGYAEDYDAFMLELLSEIQEVAVEMYRILYKNAGEITKISHLSHVDADDATNTNQEIVFYDFIYKSNVMKNLVQEINKASKYDCPVLITGETGVGKDKVTKLIHSISSRKMQPCIKVNCAAIPTSLMESEFFGYEPGSFTGASIKGKKGYFEQAHKGILFLDEISSLSLELQTKLLRVIQDNEFYRVGGEETVRVDVRVIAATNKDLKGLVLQGKFREDLYYRLAVLVIQIPALRNRKLDIIPLAEYFIKLYNAKYNMQKKISDDGLQYFLEYNWPGNIRELENLVQRVLINCDEELVSPFNVIREMSKENLANELLDDSIHEDFLKIKTNLYEEYMSEQEKSFIQLALRKYKTTRKAAEAMGMTQAQLMRKKKKYSL
jgi:DNA-binding NtrC family response regulator